MKPILALDFDGVIHLYRRGWQDGEIYDDMTTGFAVWAIDANRYWHLVIHSSRCATEQGRVAIRAWLAKQLSGKLHADEVHGFVDMFDLQATKPPARLTIDDRALTFNGSWDDYPQEYLLQFQPWTQRHE